MTLHLHSIRRADHPRSDVRCLSRISEERTDELRAEVEKVTPLLRWPIRINRNNSNQGEN